MQKLTRQKRPIGSHGPNSRFRSGAWSIFFWGDAFAKSARHADIVCLEKVRGDIVEVLHHIQPILQDFDIYINTGDSPHAGGVVTAVRGSSVVQDATLEHSAEVAG